MSRRGRRRRRRAPEAATPAPGAQAPAEVTRTPSAGDGSTPARRQGWILYAAIFGLGFLIRLLVARELGSTALFRVPQLDARELLDWAKRIAAGELAVPYYPTHGTPYPYFLGLLWKLGGGSLDIVRTVQALIGATSCALLARLAERVWASRLAAATAGVLAALYGPFVLVDVFVWEEILLMLFLALLLVAVAARERISLWTGAAGGLALGGAIAVRPTMIVLLPLALWLVLGPDVRARSRRRAAAALVVSVLLVVAPIVVAASHATGTFLFERGFGAINLWIGNDPAGGGVQNARIGGAWSWLEAETARAGFEQPAGVERYFLDKAVRRALDAPLGQLRVLGSKLVWLVQAEEPRDNHSYAFFLTESRLLRGLPGFGLVFGLAVLGIWSAWRQRRRWLWIAAYLALTALPVLAALTGLRYRLPMVPGWILLAAPAPAALRALYAARRWRALGAAALLFAVTVAATHARRHPATHVFGEEWALSGESELVLGDLAAAERAFERARDLAPRSSLGWDGIARVRLRQGKTDEAESLFREAIARDPHAIAPHENLAELLLSRGDVEAALAELNAALETNPIYQPVLEHLALAEAAHGRLKQARDHWLRLAGLGPGNAMAWRRVGQIDGALGELEEGMRAARRAVSLAPERADGWMLLGFLAVDAGDAEAAKEALAALRRTGADQGADDAPVALLDAAVDYLSADYARADEKLRALLLRAPAAPQPQALLLRNAQAWGRRAEAEAFLRSLSAAPAAPGRDSPR